LKWYRDNSVTAAAAAKLEAEDILGKFIIGEWTAPERPELTEEWSKLVTRVQSGELQASRAGGGTPPALQ
jgi:hypothetical protein